MSYFGLNLTKASSVVAWAEALGWSGPKTDPYVKWARYMAGYGTFQLNFHRFDRFELDLCWPTQP